MSFGADIASGVAAQMGGAVVQIFLAGVAVGALAASVVWWILV